MRSLSLFPRNASPILSLRGRLSQEGACWCLFNLLFCSTCIWRKDRGPSGEGCAGQRSASAAAPKRFCSGPPCADSAPPGGGSGTSECYWSVVLGQDSHVIYFLTWPASESELGCCYNRHQLRLSRAKRNVWSCLSTPTLFHSIPIPGS